jgi:hypothetical protein
MRKEPVGSSVADIMHAGVHRGLGGRGGGSASGTARRKAGATV